MRPIKFRGKGVHSNEWVFGDLIHGVGGKNGNFYILPKTVNLAYVKNCDPLDGVEVYEESVGQSTGLLDKNGKEIYEGDIVIYKYAEQGKESEYYERSDQCVFYRGVFSIGSGKLYEWGHKNGRLDMPLFKRHYVLHGANELYMVDFDIEVIGNVYENPELVDGKSFSNT